MRNRDEIGERGASESPGDAYRVGLIGKIDVQRTTSGQDKGASDTRKRGLFPRIKYDMQERAPARQLLVADERRRRRRRRGRRYRRRRLSAPSRTPVRGCTRYEGRITTSKSCDSLRRKKLSLALRRSTRHPRRVRPGDDVYLRVADMENRPAAPRFWYT